MVARVEDVFEADVFVDGMFTGVYTDVIQCLDLATKVIFINEGVSEYHPVDDIYRETRFHRAFDESLRILDMPVVASGNVSKGGGKFTARLAIFNNGWRIAPANSSHVLKVTGEQITDDGQSGVAVMNMTLFSPGVSVSIEYAPPDTEIITIEVPVNIVDGTPAEIADAVWAAVARTLTESAGLSPEESDKLLALPTKEQTAQATWDHII